MRTNSPDPRCPRCQGFLAIEHEAYGPSLIYCLNCGWRTCPTIAENLKAARPTRHDFVTYRKFPQSLTA
jgi:hypothetical protein